MGRGKAYSGTCAIAVASLLCGLNAATLPLDAQPFSFPADQPAMNEPRASFDERFSPDLRTEPFFTRPEVQNLLASLPSSPASADVLVAGPEPGAPESETEEGMPAEPQPVEDTASVTAQKPSSEATTSAPNLEIQLPEFPPPPPPADVVLPSAEEIAATTPPQAPPQAPSDISSAIRSEPDRRADASEQSMSQPQAEKKANLKKQAEQGRARVKKQTTARHEPAVTGTFPSCRAGAVCVSQQQTFAIFFGFIAGALLGGPIGAIAGGTAGAILTAPDRPQEGRSDPPPRR
ncbi:hypothetical protein AA309_17075 [Microvirga vignae]|uniref:Uncharacterized protein n=1 Tax=Microvirga vignae TaxID=1225564 RepID=A0A0H1RA96_9HYPH|nr:hypothetical protein AA309_17075 [Microvirga vignae]